MIGTIFFSRLGVFAFLESLIALLYIYEWYENNRKRKTLYSHLNLIFTIDVVFILIGIT